MKTFKVDFVFQSSGSAEKDPSLSAVVSAADEIEALKEARLQLIKDNPDFNFMKVWCWHVESTLGTTS
jgi:hypothetical protein